MLNPPSAITTPDTLPAQPSSLESVVLDSNLRESSVFNLSVSGEVDAIPRVRSFSDSVLEIKPNERSPLNLNVTGAAGTSVQVIQAKNLAKNKLFLGKSVDFYDRIIKDKTNKLPKKTLDKRCLLACVIISAIVTIASFSIMLVSIACYVVRLFVTIIPLGASIALSLIFTAGLVALMFCIIKYAEIRDIKGIEDQILVAKILKEIYSTPSIKNNINLEDEEFNKIHEIIEKFLAGSIPAGYINSKELLFALKNLSSSKEGIDICLRRTLTQFIFLGDSALTQNKEFSKGQFIKHVSLFLANYSSKEDQLASVLLETENNVPALP